MPELKSLRDEYPSRDPEFPFVLSAGQRRSSTANTIIRDPQWRPKGSGGRVLDEPGRRRPSSESQSGGRVRVVTKRASAETVVEVTDRCCPAMSRCRTGPGLWYPDREGQEFQHGVAPNELTATEDRDWFAGTPFHKHVPARIEPSEGL